MQDTIHSWAKVNRFYRNTVSHKSAEAIVATFADGQDLYVAEHSKEDDHTVVYRNGKKVMVEPGFPSCLGIYRDQVVAVFLYMDRVEVRAMPDDPVKEGPIIEAHAVVFPVRAEIIGEHLAVYKKGSVWVFGPHGFRFDTSVGVEYLGYLRQSHWFFDREAGIIHQVSVDEPYVHRTHEFVSASGSVFDVDSDGFSVHLNHSDLLANSVDRWPKESANAYVRFSFIDCKYGEPVFLGNFNGSTVSRIFDTDLGKFVVFAHKEQPHGIHIAFNDNGRVDDVSISCSLSDRCNDGPSYVLETVRAVQTEDKIHVHFANAAGVSYQVSVPV